MEQDKKVLYIDGWDEWQEGDWKVAERMKRVRERQRRAKAVTPTDTVSVTPAVTVPTVSGLSEPLAVSRKPLATSEHGDEVVHDRNGAKPAAGSTLIVGRMLDWLCVKHGWATISRDTFVAQEAIAKQIAGLGTPWSELEPSLNAMWDQTDADDRPSSLAYFWTRLQDDQHARTKQQGRSHARTDEGPTRIKPELPTGRKA